VIGGAEHALTRMPRGCRKSKRRERRNRSNKSGSRGLSFEKKSKKDELGIEKGDAMVERARIGNMTIKCDHPGCGWHLGEVKPDEIEVWHNKLCPQCGECVIINDDDLKVLRRLQLMVLLDEFIDPDGTMPLKHMRVDTAILRK
jgi:ribosomal protein S27AE